MNNKIIDKIKSRGYWRINFRPAVYAKKIDSLAGCAEIVRQNMVQVRGWNYPHYPFVQKEQAKLEVGDTYYGGWIDWDFHKEYWRMYQSGQFIHYLALREDWFDESEFVMTPYPDFKIGEGLEILSTLNQLTEIYEFLARLARNGIYEEGVEVLITLNKVMNRELKLTAPGRMPLFERYESSLENINFSKEYSKDALLVNAKSLALEVVCYIFDRFGWHTPPISAFKEDQNKLIK